MIEIFEETKPREDGLFDFFIHFSGISLEQAKLAQALLKEPIAVAASRILQQKIGC